MVDELPEGPEELVEEQEPPVDEPVDEEPDQEEALQERASELAEGPFVGERVTVSAGINEIVTPAASRLAVSASATNPCWCSAARRPTSPSGKARTSSSPRPSKPKMRSREPTIGEMAHAFRPEITRPAYFRCPIANLHA